MSRVLFQYQQTLPAWLVLKVNRFHFSQINSQVVLQDRNKPNPTQNKTEHVHPIKRSKHKQQQLTDDRRKQTDPNKQR